MSQELCSKPHAMGEWSPKKLRAIVSAICPANKPRTSHSQNTWNLVQTHQKKGNQRKGVIRNSEKYKNIMVEQ